VAWEERAYQREYPEDIRGHFRAGRRRVLMVASTGAGKTRMLGMMADEMMRKSDATRMFVVAERRLLVEQLASQMRASGLRWHVEMANLPDGEAIGNEWVRKDRDARIWIGSRDTVLSRADRHDWLDIPKFDLTVIDEVHRFERGKSRKLIERVGSPFVLGMTATPCFSDGTGLGSDNWDAIVERVTMRQLVEMGVLVPVRYFAPPELSQKRKKGEKTGVVGDPVKHWMDHAEGKRTVALLPGVKEAYAVRDRFRAAGVTAEVIDADTPPKERTRILKEAVAGKVLWTGGVGTLDTGVDVPEWEVGQILTKCGSFTKYRQFGGRVMRKCDAIGKKYAILLDHSAAVAEHGFLDEPVPWELSADGDVSERVKKEREAGERANPVCCAKCGCLFAGSPVCPECGTPLPRRERKADPDIGRELLVEVDAPQESPGQFNLRKQREWTVFLRMCVAKGWAAKKANVMFKSKFGDWPENMGVTPTFGRADRDTPVSQLCPNLVRKPAAR
jgi:superfamily II DNA or RNA helicase